MARKLKLVPVGNHCETVNVRSPYVRDGYPIGRVCREDSGKWSYYTPPMPLTRRGPVATKAKAVLQVVRGHQAWIGLDRGRVALRGARRRR